MGLTSRKELFFYDTSNVVFAVVMLAAYMLFFNNGGFNEGLIQDIVLIISVLIYLGLGIYGFASVVKRDLKCLSFISMLKHKPLLRLIPI